MERRRRLLWLLVLAIPTLACQAAMRLITPPALALAPDGSAATPEPASAATPVPSCLNEIGSILAEANNEHLPLSSFPNVDITRSVDIPLVTYDVNGDRLSAPALADVPPDLLPYQGNFAMQKRAWNLFTTMIPADQRQMLVQFQVITDGPGGVLSAVEQAPGNPSQWILETDIADMPDMKNLAFTLLHEFGHLLTLNSSQVPPDLRVFRNPDDTHIRDRAVAACTTFFPGEGCSLATSYVNVFYNYFWTDIYAEWNLIDQTSDPDRRDARLHSFYRKYNDRFVDSYAATSPVEDIAETWAYFVLNPRPSGLSISDQKMAFFYAYPELVALRQQIRAGLCTARP